MRWLLRLNSGFTAAALLWLTVMFFVLRHPGYLPNALTAAAMVAVSLGVLAMTVVDVGRWPTRLAAALLALMLLAYGASALWRNHAGAGHFEGYAEVIGLALVAQGVLTLLFSAGIGTNRETRRAL